MLLFFTKGYSRKMNKKAGYTYQYLSRTEIKF